MTQRNNTSSSSISQEGLINDPDFLRELVQRVCQVVLDSELSNFLEAKPYERTGSRKGYRNGSRPRLLKTRVGTLELLVPRDREGVFRSELFERYQRSERSLLLTLQEMVLKGVSTRKVREVTEVLCGTDFSKSQVSKLTQDLDSELRLWRERPLEGSYPYVIMDGHFEHVRQDHRVFSQGVLIVKGINQEGKREILSVEVGITENEVFWSEVCKGLIRRGLKGVKLVTSDDHGGLREAIKRYFQGCQWQRCQVHFKRNAMACLPKKERKTLSRSLKDVFEAPDMIQAKSRLKSLVEFYEGRYPQLAYKLESETEEALACFNFPEAHRRRIRSTNGLERFHRELVRRTRVIGIFPNPESCLRLVTALAMEQTEEWLSGRTYLDMSLLEEEESSNVSQEVQVPVLNC